MEQILLSLLDIAEEKHQQMQALVDLIKRQAILLQDEDVDALVEHLECKQQIMDRIDALDTHARGLEASLKEGFDLTGLEEMATSETANQILLLRTATREIIQETLPLDQQNTELGKQLLGKLQQEMQDFSKASNAQRVYAQIDLEGKGNPLSVYMNRKL